MASLRLRSMGERLLVAKERVQQIEQLLLSGLQKLEVGRRLVASRGLVDKVSFGRHKHQTDPSEFLEAYARVRRESHFVVAHVTPL